MLTMRFLSSEGKKSKVNPFLIFTEEKVSLSEIFFLSTSGTQKCKESCVLTLWTCTCAVYFLEDFYTTSNVNYHSQVWEQQSLVCWAAEMWVSTEMLPAIYPEIAEGHSLGSKHLYLNGLENTKIHTINKTNKQTKNPKSTVPSISC